MSQNTREDRILALASARAARLKRTAEELEEDIQEIRKICQNRKRLYVANASTGGMPPEECRAPLSKAAMARRLEKKRTRNNYRYYASTGFRPPHECRAPARVYPEEEVEIVDDSSNSESTEVDDDDYPDLLPLRLRMRD